MDDLIRRGALVDVLANRVPFAIVTADDVGFAQGLDAAYMAVKEAPSVDAVEAVHAKWVDAKVNGMDIYPSGQRMCGECNTIIPLEWRVMPPYCFNCGARMDAQTDGEKEAKQDG